MLTVHHLNNSRSQRVLWLLEELGVPYEIVRYQRQPDMRAPKELRAIHPLGKSPVITDNGNTIAESGAICEYIIGTYGNGRLIPPPNTPERLRYTYWLHYAEGSAMSPLLLKLLFTLMPKRAPALLRPLVRKVSNTALTTLVNPQLKQHMDYWEGELAKSEWFAGNEFTGADIQMSFPLEAAAARGGLELGHPKAMAFLERIHARPAYARALEKGGPYVDRAADGCHGCTAAITSFTSRPSPLISPVGSTLSPRRTTTRRCDGMITMRWPRSPDAKNASRGMPSRTRPLALGCSLRLVQKPAA